MRFAIRKQFGLVALLVILVGGWGFRPPEARAQVIPGDDITTLILNAENLDYFWLALTAADMGDVLRGDGEYTVFVPTDRAFRKLSPEVREKLFSLDGRDELREIIRYHIVPERLTANDLVAMGEAPPVEPTLKTMQGDALSVTDAMQGFLVENASIIEPDLKASNGIVHAIDRVLLPPSLDVMANR